LFKAIYVIITQNLYIFMPTGAFDSISITWKYVIAAVHRKLLSS